MDPITGASAFATIISLVGQFRAERGSNSQADFNAFLSWLVEMQHDELKKLVEANVITSIGIKALLNEQQDVLVAKLESINRALVSFASSYEGFSDIAQGLNPDFGLSDQAIHLLRQFESSGASQAIELHMQGGVTLVLSGGQSGVLEIRDQRFIEDDLRTLVELGLLRLGSNSKGDNVYLFTRIASQLVNQLA